MLCSTVCVACCTCHACVFCNCVLLVRTAMCLQSDIDSSSASSSDMDSPGSSADAAAGQQAEGGDPTMRAQEIINRAVSCLALIIQQAVLADGGDGGGRGGVSRGLGDRGRTGSKRRQCTPLPPPFSERATVSDVDTAAEVCAGGSTAGMYCQSLLPCLGPVVPASSEEALQL